MSERADGAPQFGAIALGAIILAGGRGSRLGADKATVALGGERLVDHAVAAARRAGASRVAVVGPDHRVSGAMRVREDPPFSGPLAALAAGLDALGPSRDAALTRDTASIGGTDDTRIAAPTWTLLLSCDLVDPVRVCDALLAGFAASPAIDGLLLRDPDGRSQWLAGLYRRETLAQRIAAIPKPLADRPLRLAFADMRLCEIDASASTTADIDTPADLERARRARTSTDRKEPR